MLKKESPLSQNYEPHFKYLGKIKIKEFYYLIIFFSQAKSSKQLRLKAGKPTSVPIPPTAPNPPRVVPLDINQWIAKQEPDARKFFSDQEVYQVLTLSKRHSYPPVANINCAYIFRGTGHPLWYRFISADNERKYPKSSIMKRNGLGHLNLKSSVFGIFRRICCQPWHCKRRG